MALPLLFSSPDCLLLQGKDTHKKPRPMHLSEPSLSNLLLTAWDPPNPLLRSGWMLELLGLGCHGRRWRIHRCSEGNTAHPHELHSCVDKGRGEKGEGPRSH